VGCDWLAVIITRITGIPLRASFQQHLFEPLGIAPDTLDSFRTPAMDAQRGSIAMHNPSDSATPFVPLPFPFETPQYEGDVPEGKNPLTSAPLWGTLPAFAIILQSLLNEEGPVDRAGVPFLSKGMWERARGDALAELGIEIPQRPSFSESVLPVFAHGIDWWKKPKVLKEEGDSRLGWSLLQATVLREEVSLTLGDDSSRR
jgi:methyl acetate hydrolase